MLRAWVACVRGCVGVVVRIADHHPPPLSLSLSPHSPRFVVDTGRVKRRCFNLRSGSSSFEVGWISRASADQRAGRAGRTGPGHAYRLYSSALFSNEEAFPPFEQPEVASTPAPSLVLSLKALGIACVASFPFPSPPPPAALHAAIRSLTNLGALVPVLRRGAQPSLLQLSGGGGDGGAGGSGTNTVARSLSSIESEELTPLGKACARLPLAPPLAKMLVLAAASSSTSSPSSSAAGGAVTLLDYAIALVAALSINEPFVRPTTRKKPAAGKAGSRSGEGGGGKRARDVDGKGAEAEGGGGADGDGNGEDGGVAAATTDSERALLSRLLQEGEGEAGGTTTGVTDKHLRSHHGGDGAFDAEEAAATVARNAAAAAHASFRHPLSDALTSLRACGAYAHAVASAGTGPSAASAGAAFCKAHWLRRTAMEEWMALRRQLHATMRSFATSLGGDEASTASAQPSSDAAAASGSSLAGGDAAEDADREASAAAAGGSDGEGEGAPGGVGGGGAAAHTVSRAEQKGGGRRGGAGPLPLLPPPSPSIELTLRQLIASSQLEHVARRAYPDTAASLLVAAGLPPSGRMKSGAVWVPYVPASSTMTPPLFLHPGTSCSNGRGSGPDELPQWVVFTELIAPADAPPPTSDNKGGNDGNGSGSSSGPPVAPDASGKPQYAHGRSYMRGVTAIEPSWLAGLAEGTPLVRYEPPLDTPPPSYDARTDALVCHAVPLFGDWAWRMPATVRPYPGASSSTSSTATGGAGGGRGSSSSGGGGALENPRLRVFARCFLEGAVAPAVAGWTASLTPPPSVLARATAGSQRRVAALLQALAHPPVAPPSSLVAGAGAASAVGAEGGTCGGGGVVDSAAQLAAVWRRFPSYLLAEYKAWLPDKYHASVDKLWPTVVRNSLALWGEGAG